MNTLFIAVALLFVVGGIFSIAPAVKTIQLARASLAWPTAPGRVTVAEVREDYDSRGRYCTPRIAFEYQVDGRSYESDSLLVGTTPSGSMPYARSVTEKYPVGAAVRVAYNPADPQRAVLEPGPRAEDYLAPFAAVLLIAAGVALFIYQANIPVDG
ncbi:MAG TPA: DUF3592 domain-containing protein [Rhodocyclaceae bacterium]|nr:DUF3592 domain-containing protein [Rhodocyclaceae bacterium]